VHVARLIGAKFPDGQLYVDLQGFALDPPLDPSAALTRLLTALGIPRDSIPSEVQAQAALFRSTVSDRSMLLLLDNAIDVEQVRPLLPGHPGCVVLITSRNDLRGLAVHPGADQVPLDVLTETESAAVLTDLLGPDRAAAEPEALAELARTCAHLPLALRIAGANLAADPGRGIADYTAEIATSGRLTELAVGGDERSAVRIAFDLSYIRLTVADQRLFRLLGLVPGADVGVPAAAALVGAVPAEARRALDRLVAANLLQRPRPGRYQFHDLIREYAVECAAADETADDRVVRVVDVLVQTATAASQLLYRPQGEAVPDALPLTTEATALQWLDEEWLNLLAVMRWAAIRPAVCRQAWRLAEALRGYFDTRGAAAEAVAACTAALHAASASGDRSAEASLLALLSTIEYNLGRYDRAIGYRVDVLRTVRDLGDTAAEADALCSIGRAQWRNGQPAAALRACREAMDVSRAAGHTDVEIEAMTVTGTVHLFRGEPLAALEWYERALALASTTGNREAVHRALHGRGNAREALGRVDEAIVDHQQVLDYCRASGRGFGETASLLNLAEAEMDSGRPTEAMVYAEEALRRGRDIGDVRAEARAHEYIAAARNELGQHRAAIAECREGLRLASGAGYHFAAASTMLVLAAAHRANGEPRAALRHAELALSTVRERGELLLEAAALSEAAQARFDVGDREAAGRLVCEAIRLAVQRGQRLVEARARLVLDRVGDQATSRLVRH
jgi:tetratricopeptide (TPR) repeat protein